MARPKKPAPIGVAHVRVRVIRGPRKHDGRWYWRAEDHGDRLTLWSGWATAAEAKAAALQVAADGKTARGARVLADLGDLMRAWVAHLEDSRPDLAAGSLTSYRLTGTRIKAHAGDWQLERFGQGDLEQLRGVLLRTLAPRTVQADLDRVVAAWSWARKLAAVPDRHLERVRVRIPEAVRFTPSPGDAARVLAQVTIPWRRVAIRLLLATGARIGEVADLRREDLDVERRTLRLDGKTGPRVVPLLPEVVRELVAHMATHERVELLGVGFHAGRGGVDKELRRACLAAGVPVFSAHALRRAAVDRFARAGVDVGTSARWMGHTPAVMMDHYRQVTDQDLVDALARVRLGALVDEDNVVELTRRRS